jgi:anti-sigma B factor antagonist
MTAPEPEQQGVNGVMSSFSVRPEPDALIISIEEPSALNDFRSNSFRDAFYETVQTHEEHRVALDLGRVDFLSSSGVAILVGLKRRVETRQGKIVLFHVHPIVSDLLKVMKLDRYFPLADDEHAAMASLRPVSTL